MGRAGWQCGCTGAGRHCERTEWELPEPPEPREPRARSAVRPPRPSRLHAQLSARRRRRFPRRQSALPSQSSSRRAAGGGAQRPGAGPRRRSPAPAPLSPRRPAARAPGRLCAGGSLCPRLDKQPPLATQQHPSPHSPANPRAGVLSMRSSSAGVGNRVNLRIPRSEFGRHKMLEGPEESPAIWREVKRRDGQGPKGGFDLRVFPDTTQSAAFLSALNLSFKQKKLFLRGWT